MHPHWVLSLTLVQHQMFLVQVNSLYITIITTISKLPIISLFPRQCSSTTLIRSTPLAIIGPNPRLWSSLTRRKTLLFTLVSSLLSRVGIRGECRPSVIHTETRSSQWRRIPGRRWNQSSWMGPTLKLLPTKRRPTTNLTWAPNLCSTHKALLALVCFPQIWMEVDTMVVIPRSSHRRATSIRGWADSWRRGRTKSQPIKRYQIVRYSLLNINE